MRKITIEMIKKWEMLNYDWMYYKVSDARPFTYHHLLIPCRMNQKRTIRNGAVLCGNGSSHNYIHLIERIDPDRYDAITLILKEVNLQEFMTTEKQYKAIDDILKGFEKEYSGTTDRNGKSIIKEDYIKRGKLL